MLEIEACGFRLDIYEENIWSGRMVILERNYASSWSPLDLGCEENEPGHANGDCFEMFTPTQGFRQGDPISSYLLLLKAEGLSYL